MKKGYIKCPFCANEIKEGAVKCQFCEEFLDGRKVNNKRNFSLSKKTWIIIGCIILFVFILLCILKLFSKDSETMVSDLGQTSKKEQCVAYRDKYLNYIKTKENISEEIPSLVYLNEDGKKYTDLGAFTMFYSEKVDKCIAGYTITYRTPVKGGHDDDGLVYIKDALTDETISRGLLSRGARDCLFNDLDYYLSGEGELCDWDFYNSYID